MKRFSTLAVLLAPLPLAAATVEYEKQLLPLLKDNCLPCHNKTTTKGGLNMETVELMLKGGDNGPGLVRGDGAKSLLYQAAAGEWDSEMPPKNNKVSAVPIKPTYKDQPKLIQKGILPIRIFMFSKKLLPKNKGGGTLKMSALVWVAKTNMK